MRSVKNKKEHGDQQKEQDWQKQGWDRQIVVVSILLISLVIFGHSSNFLVCFICKGRPTAVC